MKLRGIETKSIEEIKLDKTRKRYEYNTVKLKRNIGTLKRETKGVVLEIIDLQNCFVEFGAEEKEIQEMKLKDLLICK